MAINIATKAILKILSFGGIDVEVSRQLADLKRLDPMKIFYKKMQKLFVSAFQIILCQNVALNLHRFHMAHSVAVKKHFRHFVPVEYRFYFRQNHLNYSDLSVH